jgi:UDP:flavonoid glycosyltransferase YjiC (YdhE family)
MRLTLLTIGSRGDVQPMVALGQGLHRAGHEVRVATFGSFRRLVEDAGLALAPLAGTGQDLTDSEEGRAMLESGENIVKHIRAIRAISRKLVQTEGYWESLHDACHQADAIVYHYTAPQGFHLAENLGIPSIMTAIAPSVVPTSAFPHPFWPGEPKLGSSFNRATHWVCEQFMWQPFRTMVNQWRQEHLGLPPVPLRGPYPQIRRSLVIYAFSPSLVPRAPDWGERVQVTGFWFMELPAWQPDRRLMDFLSAGSPPVYIGFGSVGSLDEEAALRIVREALRLSGQRGVVNVRSENLRAQASASDFLPVGDVPHEWLFPRMAAVVHHGGSGSTGAGLRAGVPNIVVPFFSDQPFWGRRVAAVGAGPAPIPRKELTPERLAAAITKAVSDPSIRHNAAAIGEKIRAENGVQRAVEIIERYLSAVLPDAVPRKGGSGRI